MRRLFLFAMTLFGVMVGCTQKEQQNDSDDDGTTTIIVNNYYSGSEEDDPVIEYFDYCTEDPKEMDVWDQDKIFTYYISISDDQLAMLNALGYTWYDVDTHIYPYADFLVVWDEEGNCGVIEKPEARILGEMNWTALPGKSNIGLDTDQFLDGQELGDDEHPSFHSGLYGGRFREPFMYNYLIPSFGLHSKPVSWMWLSANFWGGLPEDGGLQLDYQLHPRWKADQLDKEIGKDQWVAAWEGFGDFSNDGWTGYPSCQEGPCEDELLELFALALASPDEYGGIIAVLDQYIEGGHEAFFTFWGSELLIDQWDGYYAAQHNFVVVLLTNGKFVFLHHSLDLAMNDLYGSGVDLFGFSVITRACQADDACANAFVDHLEQMNVQWEASVQVYQEELQIMYDVLNAHDMIYKEDPADFAALQEWISGRPAKITEAIRRYRECGLTYYSRQRAAVPPPGGGGIDDTQVWWDTQWDTNSYDDCLTDTGSTDSASDTGATSDSADSAIDPQ